jgi:hypothetical protein
LLLPCQALSQKRFGVSFRPAPSPLPCETHNHPEISREQTQPSYPTACCWIKENIRHANFLTGLGIFLPYSKAGFRLGVRPDVQPKSSIPICVKVEIDPKGFTLGVKANRKKNFNLPKLLINAELYGLVLAPRLKK